MNENNGSRMKFSQRPVPYALRWIFSMSTIYPLLMVAQKIGEGLIPSLQVIAVAGFVDAVLRAAAHTAQWQAALWPLAGIGATMLYSQLSGKATHFASVRLSNIMLEKTGCQLMRKYGRLAWKNLECQDKADLIARVVREPQAKLSALLNNVLSIASLVITVASLMLIIVAQVWWAGAVIFVLSAPLFWLAAKSGKANYNTERVTTKYRRRYEYLGSILSGRDTADERTLFGYSAKLTGAWRDNFTTARKIILWAKLIWHAKMKIGGVLTSLVSLLVILALLQPVLDKELSIGMFIALVNATFSLVQRTTWELTWYMDELAMNREFIRDAQAFLQLEETVGAGEKTAAVVPKLQKLEFRNVTFKYPGTDRLILDDLSFTIEAGQHYAFVGLNGAGKTTVVKLLSGLYREYEGEILFNDMPLRTLEQQQINALCAVAWQDFSRYQLTLRENILLGINDAADDELAPQLERAVSVLELAETVARLPDGLDSKLGKIHAAGVDLSGGQWQRLALARFMLNPAPLRILDEPTAALDPLSESRLYEKFEELSRGQTTIFISHRLGSTKLADRIFVLDNGRIAESGTHAELLGCGGIYCRMYESQRGWYQL